MVAPFSSELVTVRVVVKNGNAGSPGFNFVRWMPSAFSHLPPSAANFRWKGQERGEGDLIVRVFGHVRQFFDSEPFPQPFVVLGLSLRVQEDCPSFDHLVHQMIAFPVVLRDLPREELLVRVDSGFFDDIFVIFKLLEPKQLIAVGGRDVLVCRGFFLGER